MASSARCNGGGEEEKIAAELSKTLKEGERLIPATRRPDGSIRKPVRIRAGYIPQDEVAIYQSKGAIMKKEMESLRELPPGYDPVNEPKPKTKSAKRNERKKEKRQQAAGEKGKTSEENEISPAEDANNFPVPVESVASQMNQLSISSSAVGPPPDSTESSTPVDQVQDIDKKIRALKKKIRLTEAQQQKTVEKNLNPEQMEKVSKLESWREELKLLENKKEALAISSC